jgi:DNA-binding response OmpR family regulator
MPNPLAIIIEDDPNLGPAYQRILQKAGFDTALDDSGLQYHMVAEIRRPALILLNLSLPFADSKIILAGLRESPKTNKAHILVIDSEPPLAGQLGITKEQILAKPINPADLLTVVKNLFPLQSTTKT